ncbi:MAG: redox-regulated ATPase YchF [Marinilabiliaceae bacterium]|nr:redox-regulated ATPase YchF [Marinilabiliaceae bacterium]
MSLNCGIVGLTNSGKTTIFNCVSNTKAEASNFAFSAIKSNLGMADVPDPRLYEIDELIKSAKVVPATVNLTDLPGLAKGASHGEGVGNVFLSDIQKTSALIHVIRCFDDATLAHIEGSINPVRDKEIIDLELQVRDLDLIERKILKYEKIAKSGDKEAKNAITFLLYLKEKLENFTNLRDIQITEKEEETYLNDLFLLTLKPVIYVCNVDDTSAIVGNDYSKKLIEAVTNEKSEVIVIAGKLESEIAELDSEEDRKLFLQDAGLNEPGVNRLIRSAYKLLNLQSFFTAGPKETRAWTIKQGMTAQQAAGVIHSDLERGFIRAEVMTYQDLLQYKTEHAVKEAGKFRLEGKNYIVKDGDILHIRFNV